MDRNFLIAISLSLLVLLVWSNFEAQRRSVEEGAPVTAEPSAPGGAPAAGRAPAAPQELPAPIPAPRAAGPETTPAPAASLDSRQPEERIVVYNDLFEAELSSYGGGLRRFELKEYVDRSVPEKPRVELTTLDTPGSVALETPLEGLGFGDLSRADYSVESQNAHTVLFTRNFGGVTVRKLYSFEPEGYGYRLRITVENGTDRTLLPTFEVQWPAFHRDAPDFKDQTLIAMPSGELERSRLDSVGQTGLFAFGALPPEGAVFPREVDWGGVELRYFLSALIPDVPREATARFIPLEPGRAAVVAVGFRAIEVPPGQSAAREYRGYIGPKEPARVTELGAGVEASLNQGWAWLAPLSAFFVWALHACYAIIPNYGFAIIFLTVLVRLVTAPLTAKQMKSMKKMTEVQPRLKELQEKYKDDRQKQQEEMMKLYRETGVNPLGGCLPLLLQFPVFIGLYYALQSSIDLRQAPFVLWIDDLSLPETLFTLPGIELPVRVLPLVMGASMILQQRMTPSTMDPAQARMMMTVMPVMFTVLFYQFPSGLVLYWMMSNLLAIGHQMWMNRTAA